MPTEADQRSTSSMHGGRRTRDAIRHLTTSRRGARHRRLVARTADAECGHARCCVGAGRATRRFTTVHRPRSGTAMGRRPRRAGVRPVGSPGGFDTLDLLGSQSLVSSPPTAPPPANTPGIEYAALPVSVRCAVRQSNTAPDNAAALSSSCQSSNYLTSPRMARLLMVSWGLPSRGGRSGTLRFPDVFGG